MKKKNKLPSIVDNDVGGYYCKYCNFILNAYTIPIDADRPKPYFICSNCGNKHSLKLMNFFENALEILTIVLFGYFFLFLAYSILINFILFIPIIVLLVTMWAMDNYVMYRSGF